MRVSNKSIYDAINHNLARSSDAMLEANKLISTGRRINRLSDDPVGMVSVLSLRSSLDHIDQLERNIAMGESWLTMGETALSQVEDLLSRAKALTIQMSSDSQGAVQRANAAEAVEGTLEQVLSLANTKVDGRYIFAGTNTDTGPFELQGDGTVSYLGNDTEFEVHIAKQITLAVGRDGEDVFGDPGAGEETLFETLSTLKDDLEANNADGIRAAIDRLDVHLDRLGALIADTGSKHNRLELKETIIQDLRLTYTDRRSQLEDADLAEAVMDLQARQLAYQAALKSSAQVMKLSLVNFL